MPKCILCNKKFISESKLLIHKNKKSPCNIKTHFECRFCDITFEHKSKLETHNLSKLHMNNINILGVTPKLQTPTPLWFGETNLDMITLYDLKNILFKYENTIVKINKIMEKMTADYKYNSELIINVFKIFIEIFTKLEFNLALTEDDNCFIFMLSKSKTDFIIYELLEINNIKHNYFKKRIDFNLYIDDLIILMRKVNRHFFSNQLAGGLGAFNLMISYAHGCKYNLYNYDHHAKSIIETELLIAYEIFEKLKLEFKTEDEKNEEHVKILRKNAFRHIIF